MTSIIDYLTTFELTNDRERAFFRTIASLLASAGRSVVDGSVNLYQKTPATVKAGIVASAVTAGAILGYQALTQTTSDRAKSEGTTICINYSVERAPHASPLDVSDCVTPERLAELYQDPYVTIRSGRHPFGF
ncbi:MAG TPA: hypothetical protein VJI15_04810 [Candidatus Nanoarchaeia archaeon]|nr:hypothetical protein [Candidatus Nanoarchaeia archaeon]